MGELCLRLVNCFQHVNIPSAPCELSDSHRTILKRKHTVQNIQMFNLINEGIIRDFTHIDAFKFSHNFKKYPPFLKHL